ncbi:hypothetical protein ACFXAE_35690 [Streptomyces sp. NPDC059454]|uniref:hypothetical protein n=1 Tax=Streptomyces sp. NPDC059454 TaxID=3346836 RepID=UPI0036B54931
MVTESPDRVAWRMLHLVFPRLSAPLVLLSRSAEAGNIGLLAPRDENAVPRRRLGVRPRGTWPGSGVPAALARRLPSRLRRNRPGIRLARNPMAGLGGRATGFRSLPRDPAAAAPRRSTPSSPGGGSSATTSSAGSSTSTATPPDEDHESW